MCRDIGDTRGKSSGHFSAAGAGFARGGGAQHRARSGPRLSPHAVDEDREAFPWGLDSAGSAVLGVPDFPVSTCSEKEPPHWLGHLLHDDRDFRESLGDSGRGVEGVRELSRCQSAGSRSPEGGAPTRDEEAGQGTPCLPARIGQTPVPPYLGDPAG